MELTEKMSYLKGLFDGLELDTTTKEGKLLVQMIDVMQEMADTVEDLQVQVDELSELCEILDEDLGEVEEDVYDFDDCDCGCGCDDEDDDDDDDDYDFDNDELYEVCCPECGDTVILDELMLEEGSIDCPNCGSCLEFDFDDIELADSESIDTE